MGQVKERTKTEQVWRKVCGVRYLVQDKPAGVMLQPQFVEGLRWLGQQGFAFDLGVDARQGGLHQLREAVEMIDRLGDANAGAIIISESHFQYLSSCESNIWHVDHLCKPNLRLSPDTVSSHPEFLEWKELITKMAQASSRTYMKLSGAFSELPPLDSNVEPDIPNLVDRLQPWTDVVFEAFGAARVMFGSDWPVCNIGGGGNNVAWNRWIKIVEGVLERRGLTEGQKQGVWGQVALKAYGISI
jgi:L-rhamnono-1,4-lactonase